FALKQAANKLASLLPAEYSIEVIDVHHQKKKDAPSGTAKLLVSEIQNASKKFNRQIPVHSLRGGTEVGEHRVLVLGPDERLELSHHAQDRSLFAHGAIRLAKSLMRLRAKGRAYTVDELFLSDN